MLHNFLCRGGKTGPVRLLAATLKLNTGMLPNTGSKPKPKYRPSSKYWKPPLTACTPRRRLERCPPPLTVR